MNLKLIEYLNHGRYFRSKRPLTGEDKITYDFRQWLTDETIEGRIGFVWFHVANEISDNKAFVFGAKLRALGKLPGVSDYIFIKGNRSAVLELKSGKNRLSDSQHIFLDWCAQHGVLYCVARSVEEAQEFVKLFEES